MECHRCRWSAMIKKWEHDGTPFEQTPCSTCTLSESSAGTVAFDEWHWGGASGAADPGERVDELEAEVGDQMSEVGGRRAEDGADLLPVSVLADAVRLLMSLPKDALEVVRLRYGGMPYAKIAELMGKSVDAVEKRHLREIEKHPALGELFPRKVRKQRARLRRKKGKGKIVG